MKFGTITPYPFTATYVNYTTSVDQSTGAEIRNYYDDGEFQLQFVVSGAARKFVIYTKVRLRDFARVKDVKDAGGRYLMEGDIFEIKYEMPVSNSFGFSEGYSYMITPVVELP